MAKATRAAGRSGRDPAMRPSPFRPLRRRKAAVRAARAALLAVG